MHGVEGDACILYIGIPDMNWINATYSKSPSCVRDTFIQPQTWHLEYWRYYLPEIIEIFSPNWNKYITNLNNVANIVYALLTHWDLVNTYIILQQQHNFVARNMGKGASSYLDVV